jgi:hypothetical protein
VFKNLLLTAFVALPCSLLAQEDVKLTTLTPSLGPPPALYVAYKGDLAPSNHAALEKSGKWDVTWIDAQGDAHTQTVTSFGYTQRWQVELVLTRDADHPVPPENGAAIQGAVNSFLGTDSALVSLSGEASFAAFGGVATTAATAAEAASVVGFAKFGFDTLTVAYGYAFGCPK